MKWDSAKQYLKSTKGKRRTKIWQWQEVQMERTKKASLSHLEHVLPGKMLWAMKACVCLWGCLLYQLIQESLPPLFFLSPTKLNVPDFMSENITSNWSCKSQQNIKLEIKQKCSSVGAQECWANFLMQWYSNWNNFFLTASLTKLIELNVFCGAS